MRDVVLVCYEMDYLDQASETDANTTTGFIYCPPRLRSSILTTHLVGDRVLYFKVLIDPNQEKLTQQLFGERSLGSHIGFVPQMPCHVCRINALSTQ